MFNQVLGMVELRVGTAKAPALLFGLAACCKRCSSGTNSSITSIRVDTAKLQKFWVLSALRNKSTTKRKEKKMKNKTKQRTHYFCWLSSFLTGHYREAISWALWSVTVFIIASAIKNQKTEKQKTQLTKATTCVVRGETWRNGAGKSDREDLACSCLNKEQK